MRYVALTEVELETAIDALRDREEQTLEQIEILSESADENLMSETDRYLNEAAKEYGDLADRLEDYRA